MSQGTAKAAGLTDTELRASRVPVDGSGVTQPVSGTFWQATQPVSGTFFQATQPVSLASAVPVTDNSGSLTVDAPVGTPVFVRLSDGSAALATLPVSLASVPSHAVTNAGTFATQADTELPAAAALSDAIANPTAPMVGAGAMRYDPVADKFVRQPTYQRVVVLASASRAASTYAATVTPRGLRRMNIYIQQTVNGGGNLTLFVNDSSGNYRLATVAAVINTNTTNVYTFTDSGLPPGGAGLTYVTQSFALALPGSFIINITSTATATWSWEYELMP